MNEDQIMTAMRYLGIARHRLTGGVECPESILAARVFSLIAYKEDDLYLLIEDIKKEHQKPTEIYP